MRHLILDAGPAQWLAHPEHEDEAHAWVQSIADAGGVVSLPDVVVFEAVRPFMAHRQSDSIDSMRRLMQVVNLMDSDRDIMWTAAQLWAEARQAGRPGAGPDDLDADCIIAAHVAHLQHALAEAGDSIGIEIVTTNTGHFTTWDKRWAARDLPRVQVVKLGAAMTRRNPARRRR